MTIAPVAAIVQVAMPDEAEPFLQAAHGTLALPKHANTAMWRCEVGAVSLLLVQSGIGLVNAATATAIALTQAAPRLVVSAGSAGGVDPAVNVGEVVAGTEYTYPSANAQAFGYAPGQIPGMPASYVGDAQALAALAALDTDLTIHTGLMASADTFVSADAVAPLRANFPGVLSTDMESAAIAQTCFSAGIAFISVRGISDLCGPAASADFATHIDDAAQRSATVVLALLRSYPQ